VVVVAVAVGVGVAAVVAVGVVVVVAIAVGVAVAGVVAVGVVVVVGVELNQAPCTARALTNNGGGMRMKWDKIEVSAANGSVGFKSWTALSGSPHKEMCPVEHPVMYQVNRCSNGWAASYGYLSYLPGGHKTEYYRTDIIAVCDTPELAMSAAEAHENSVTASQGKTK
jgi:hypothetical protein